MKAVGDLTVDRAHGDMADQLEVSGHQRKRSHLRLMKKFAVTGIQNLGNFYEKPIISGNNMKSLAIAVTTVLFASMAHADSFSFSFTWDGLKTCNTGNPRTVSNPAFVVQGVPAGTQFIEFRLKDLDVPSFNHGGGTVAVSSDGTIPTGAFKYQSPCPPGGKHRYEWTATAKDKKGFGGKKLAVAKAVRNYPE